MTTLKPIRSEDECEAALARIEALWDAPEGSPDSDEMEALAILVEAYEREAHPVAPPDPIEAVRFAMEQRGLKPKDLERILGSSGRVSEVMRRRRPLTLRMIRRLHNDIGVDPETLIREYKIQRPRSRKKTTVPKKASARTRKSGTRGVRRGRVPPRREA